MLAALLIPEKISEISGMPQKIFEILATPKSKNPYMHRNDITAYITEKKERFFEFNSNQV